MPVDENFYAHIIFATKGWQPMLTESLRSEITDRLKRNFHSKVTERAVQRVWNVCSRNLHSFKGRGALSVISRNQIEAAKSFEI